MKKIQTKKWIIIFCLVTVLVFIGLGVFAYFFDPFYFYSYEKSNYKFINERMSMIGLIKNYTYDYAIMGSSMTQNFDNTDFIGYKPLKINKGGMLTEEILLCLNLVNKNHNDVSIFFNIDLFSLLAQKNPLKIACDYYPKYMVNDYKIDDIKYLLGYTTWMRFIPIDVCTYIISKLGIELPDKFKQICDIDKIGYWYDDYAFGKEVVKKEYKGNYSITSYENVDLKNMKLRVDELIVFLKDILQEEQKITFGFPPYSALTWYTHYENNSLDLFLVGKQYLISELLKLPNVTIVDLQTLPQIIDLNYYKDASHFDLALQKIYAESVINNINRVENINDILNNKKELLRLLNIFIQQNSDWL